MTRPPRGLCAAGGIERTNSGAGVDRPLQLRCGPLRGTGRREPQDWAHPRQARAALPAACAAVCAKGNWAHPPSEKSSKRRPGSGRDAESTAQIRQQLKRRDSSIGNSIGRGKRPEGRSDFLLSQSKFLPQERALSPLPSRQQLCRQASAYLEGKSRLAITGVRNFRWAHRGYAGPESLRRVDFLPVCSRSAGSPTSGSMHVNQDLLAVEPEISRNWPRGNRDRSSAVQPVQMSSPAPVITG
ncbi:hypothetical protein GGQ07_003065 [Salinibacter ruber]|nr:hypothetical protein [Salinibacter ruber]